MTQVIYQSLFKNTFVILEQFQNPKIILEKYILTIDKNFSNLVELELHLNWFVKILAKFIS